MLLAIDVGNTHIVFGIHDGDEWRAIWRHVTDADCTEDQLFSWLRPLFDHAQLNWRIDGAICASVSPAVNDSLKRLCEKYFNVKLLFLKSGSQVGVKVRYEPPTAVGADRLANALGVISLGVLPAIVVDFGTGTTFDAINEHGTYLGGAILPGILVSSEALFRRAAKLPQVDQIPLVAPPHAIGSTTVESLQSGVVLGYAAAIDGLASRIRAELGGKAKVVATGGLGEMFLSLSTQIESYEPNLTLNGLRVAYSRLADPG